MRSLFRRSLPYTAAATGATAIVLLARNDWDVASLGPLRLARAGTAAALIIWDYKVSELAASPDPDSRWARSAVHQRSADRLHRLACLNGGVWIKVGQHLGALEYLLPKEYTRTLSRLHSDAPQSSYAEVRKVLREELGAELEEVFVDFSEAPIGAASLAQVHSARLKESPGQRVAVKVQHPRVKPHSRVDTITMEALTKVAGRLFPEFKLGWLAEEMKKNLPVELDFCQEGQAADRVREMFKHLSFLKVPEVVWPLTTDRVLTMEFCEGGQINDLDFITRSGVDANQVCRDVGRLFSEMIFEAGYVHCDPHPGNVLVQPTGRGREHRIVLLDHGLYTTLDEAFRERYAQLWMSLLGGDLDGIKRWAVELGVGDLYGLFACMLTARSWQSITEGSVGRAKISASEAGEIQSYVASLVPQISDVIDRVPRPMILIFKTNDLIRSIEHRLRTESQRGAFIQMSRCCVRSLARISLRKEGGSVASRLRTRLWAAFHLTRLWLAAAFFSLTASRPALAPALAPSQTQKG